MNPGCEVEVLHRFLDEVEMAAHSKVDITPRSEIPMRSVKGVEGLIGPEGKSRDMRGRLFATSSRRRMSTWLEVSFILFLFSFLSIHPKPNHAPAAQRFDWCGMQLWQVLQAAILMLNSGLVAPLAQAFHGGVPVNIKLRDSKGKMLMDYAKGAFVASSIGSRFHAHVFCFFAWCVLNSACFCTYVSGISLALRFLCVSPLLIKSNVAKPWTTVTLSIVDVKFAYCSGSYCLFRGGMIPHYYILNSFSSIGNMN